VNEEKRRRRRAEFRELDERLQRFFAKHGELFDWLFIIAIACIVAALAGYMTGKPR
jgi:hypothetical protein